MLIGSDSNLLNTKTMDGLHTGEYISELFLGMMEEWGVEQERVTLVLRGGGSNMVKGMRLAEMTYISCCAQYTAACC